MGATEECQLKFVVHQHNKQGVGAPITESTNILVLLECCPIDRSTAGTREYFMS